MTAACTVPSVYTHSPQDTACIVKRKQRWHVRVDTYSEVNSKLRLGQFSV